MAEGVPLPTGPLRSSTFAERYPGMLRAPRAGAAERWVDHVQAFSARHVAAQAPALEQAAANDPNFVPQDLLDAACRAGLFSAPFPAWLGGGGVPFAALLAGHEILATDCVGVANLFGVSGLAIGCVMATFDPRALERIAALVCAGERRGEPVFLSTCVTEPGAGSDAEDADEFEHAQLRTLAKPVAGGWRLSGTKIFISNGSLAALHVVAAFTDPRHRPEDFRLFLVPADAPGVRIVRNEHKLGQKICPASVVEFEDVFVPTENLCRGGAPAEFAWNGLANVLGLTRAGVGAFAAGVAEGAWLSALELGSRVTWRGRPLYEWQWARVELAELARLAQVARSVWQDALAAVLTGGLLAPVDRLPDPPLVGRLLRPAPMAALRRRVLGSDAAYTLFRRIAAQQTAAGRESACGYGDVAKVSASDIAVEVCSRAIALCGKVALRREAGLEKRLRDARLLQIYEGTNQVNMLDYVKRRLLRQTAAV